MRLNIFVIKRKNVGKLNSLPTSFATSTVSQGSVHRNDRTLHNCNCSQRNRRDLRNSGKNFQVRLRVSAIISKSFRIPGCRSSPTHYLPNAFAPYLLYTSLLIRIPLSTSPEINWLPSFDEMCRVKSRASYSPPTLSPLKNANASAFR